MSSVRREGGPRARCHQGQRRPGELPAVAARGAGRAESVPAGANISQRPAEYAGDRACARLRAMSVKRKGSRGNRPCKSARAGTAQAATIKRTNAELAAMLQQQYVLLADSIDGYYSGNPLRALDIAVRIRVLVHETPNSRSLLGQLDNSYFTRDIFDVHPASPRSIIFLPLRIRLDSAGGQFERPQFTPEFCRRVRLSRWWNDDYIPIRGGAEWLTKKDIVLNVANKEGGAHVDGAASAAHAELNSSWVLLQNGRNVDTGLILNNALGVVANAGCELKEFLENHFGCAPQPSGPAH
jgi:hypothetical protein